MDIKRVFLIILDSVGMGTAPDAAEFGDINPNTLGHIAASVPGFKLPNMQYIGLGNIDGMEGFEASKYPLGSFARLRELSAGKDTTIGHWELSCAISIAPSASFRKIEFRCLKNSTASRFSFPP